MFVSIEPASQENIFERADHPDLYRNVVLMARTLGSMQVLNFMMTTRFFGEWKRKNRLLNDVWLSFILWMLNDAVLKLMQQMAVMAAQNRALQNNGFSSDDLGLFDEGLSQFHPSNSFGCLLDVLDDPEQN